MKKTTEELKVELEQAELLDDLVRERQEAEKHKAVEQQLTEELAKLSLGGAIALPNTGPKTENRSEPESGEVRTGASRSPSPPAGADIAVPAPVVPAAARRTRATGTMAEALKLPAFTGTDPAMSVDRFVDMVDALQAQRNASDETMAGAVKNALKEDAYTWFRRMDLEETEGRTRWKNEGGADAAAKAQCLRALLKGRFGPKLSMAEIRAKIEAMKMGPNERVEGFEDRCHVLQYEIELLDKSNQETAEARTQRLKQHETAVCCMFLNGLPQALREKMQLKTKSESLADYVEAAKLIQQAQRDTNAKKVNEVKTEEEEGKKKKKNKKGKEEQPAEAGAEQQSDVQQLVTDFVNALQGARKKTRPQNQGAQGGQSGSQQRQWQPRWQRDSNMECFNCHEIGHRAANCPKPATEETIQARNRVREKRAQDVNEVTYQEFMRWKQQQQKQQGPWPQDF